MQNLEDLRNKLFFESRNIIETLAKIASPEELLSKKDLVEELNERISFLKLLEKNEMFFVEESTLQSNDNQQVNTESNDTNPASENQDKELEEEVLFTNELNEFNKDEIEEDKKRRKFLLKKRLSSPMKKYRNTAKKLQNLRKKPKRK